MIETAKPGTPTYNVPLAMRWTEPVEPAALESALGVIVARHEALRTVYRFDEGRGGPVQVVEPDARVSLTVVESPREPTEADCVAEAVRPFDLAAERPVRCTLWRGAPGGDTVLLTFHHIAIDGWSLAPLFEELSELYDAASTGRRPAVSPPPVRYRDYAVWDRQVASAYDTGRLAEERAAEIAPVAGPLLLGASCGEPDGSGGVRRFDLDGDVWAGVHELAARLRATPFAVLLAAYEEILRRWSGAPEFLVGTVTVNRPHPSLESLIGCFVNLVPLRCRPRPKDSFAEHCAAVRAESFRALTHQRIPFDQLAAALRRARGGAPSAVNVCFGLQNMPGPRHDRPQRWAPPVLLNTGRAKFDLMLLVEERPDGVLGTVELDRGRYTDDIADELADTFQALLAAAVRAPDRTLAALPLTRTGRRGRGVHAGPVEDLRRFHPSAHETIVELVVDRLRASADAPAVTCRRETLTRRGLDEWSAGIASALAKRGLGRGDLVPVLAARGGGLVAAWLGTLRAGAAYVALGLDTPPERLAYVLDDVGARLVLTDAAGAAALRAAAAADVVDVDACRSGASDTTAEPVAFTGDEAAIVIYTSGTTGRPKGALVPHRGLANTALWWAEDSRLGESDCVLCVLGTAFDPASFETFRALAAGSELVFADEAEREDPAALLRLMRSATTVSMTPSLLRLILDTTTDEDWTDDPLSALRVVYLGGEALPESVVAAWSRRCRVPLRNVYGPAEASCTSTVAAVDPQAGPPYPIGRPIWNMRCAVRGPYGEELPTGVSGELYLGGAGVGAGYVADDAGTAERFVRDPLGAVVYRTGDRVAAGPDGQLRFLGRTDEQIKIAGTRIEPAEVARLLEEHPAVQAAWVQPHGAPPRLVAYVELRGDDGRPPSRGELIGPLRRWLPAAALPVAVYRVASIPLTANDKVDADALAELPATELPIHDDGDVELSPRHRWAAGVVARTLRETRDGAAELDATSLRPNDDFFSLGGHSLLAVRMLAAVERETGVHLSLPDFLDDPSVDGLASLYEAAAGAGPAAHDSHVEPDRSGPFPASPAQQRLAFLDRLEQVREAYLAPTIVEVKGTVDRGALRHALSAVLARHPALRSRFALDLRRRIVTYTTDAPPPPVVEVDARAWTDAALWRRLSEACWTPFDLRRDQPARAEILDTGDRLSLAIVTHHIVTDGWSHEVLMSQLEAAYAAALGGREAALPDPVHPARLPDPWTALTERERAERIDAAVERLRGAPTDVQLPRDRARGALQSTRGAVDTVRLRRETSERLRAALAAERCTAAMGAAALFAAALRSRTGQDDFVFAFPWAGRESAEAEHAVAMLIKTGLLRVRAAGAWRDLLGAVRAESLASYRLADVPLDAVAARLQPERDLSRPALTPVLVTAAETPPAPPRLPGAATRYLPVPDLRVKYELELTLTNADEVELTLAYATDLFDAETAGSLLDDVAAAAEELAGTAEPALLVSGRGRS